MVRPSPLQLSSCHDATALLPRESSLHSNDEEVKEQNVPYISALKQLSPAGVMGGVVTHKVSALLQT